MQTPHDRLFKRVFSNPEEAAGELRHVLPAAVTRLIDWSTLRTVRATFIDDHLAETRSDLLFSVMLGGRPAFVYALLEHQSTCDALMAFRVLAYMVRIWEAHLREYPKSDRLPVIVPVVVHHSERGWTAPLSFSEVIDLDEETQPLLAEYVPSFTYRLDEISEASDAELLSRSMTAFGRLALLCLSRSRSEDLVSVLERFLDRAREVLNAPNGVAALATILSYIHEVTESSPERVQQVVRRLGQRGEEANMTAAQILLERGRQEGEAKGEAKVLLKQLQLKFGELPESVVRRVRDARIEELDRWVERVITASSLDEVFTD